MQPREAHVETASPSAEGHGLRYGPHQHRAAIGLRSMTDFEGSEGLSTQAVEELRKQHGYNEVKTKPVPEWKKLLKRYTDWISIIIVRTCMLATKFDVRLASGSGTKPPLLLCRSLQLLYRLLYPTTEVEAGPVLFF